MPHRFEPRRKHLLDSPERRKALPADEILSYLPLAPDQTVADIGSGTGYFTLPLASKLTQGKVYAVDISQEMLDTLRDRLSQAGVKNVELVKSDEMNIPLRPASLDGALLMSVLHENDDRVAFLKMVKRLLKPGSWVGLVEWAKRDMPAGPPLAVRIGPAEARALAEQAGFKAVAQRPISDSFYFMLLKN